MNAAAAAEPVAMMSWSRPMVAFTPLRFAAATSVPASAGTETAPSRNWLTPMKLTTAVACALAR